MLSHNAAVSASNCRTAAAPLAACRIHVLVFVPKRLLWRDSKLPWEKIVLTPSERLPVHKNDTLFMFLGKLCWCANQWNP